MTTKKEIIYPIFINCCKYTKDIFWENIFEDLAYGKTPYGTYISKNFLCCSYKKKEFNYKIEEKHPKTLYNEIYNLLNKKLGLLSHEERITKKKDFIDTEENIKESRKNWNDIKKKNIKDLLIELYVSRMKYNYELTIKQSRYLYSVISLAMIFKIITQDDIEYKNGHIKKINGIDFDKKQIIIKKNIYNLDYSNISSSYNTLQERKLLSDNWEKYLKEVRKLIEKY